MKNRSESRDIIVKVLYQKYIFDNSNIKYNINDLKKELVEVSNEFIDSSIDGIIKNQDNITKIANKYLKDWTIDRLSKVDKAILSLGIYELLYTDTPSIVAINEAIILAKKYSDDKVVKMINAALDQVYHNEGKDE
jgi:N utilization substance protein B